jgi:DNA-binding SARP family transcriptional activator
MTMASPQLQLLGGFRMVNEGCILAVPVTAAKLVARLALHEHPLPRSRIAGEFWPEVPQRRAAANLRTTVWRLPKVSKAFLTTAGTTIALADSVEVDLRVARGVVRNLLDRREPQEPGRVQVELLSRPLLPEWDEDWLVFERERVRQLHIHALERLGQSFLEAGDPLSAVDVGITVLVTEPLRETAHVLVMNAYLASGNRADARRCYDRYRDLLRRELDLEPALDWADVVAAASEYRRPAPQPR